MLGLAITDGNLWIPFKLRTDWLRSFGVQKRERERKVWNIEVKEVLKRNSIELKRGLVYTLTLPFRTLLYLYLLKIFK